jgi:hypothetical protein
MAAEQEIRASKEEVEGFVAKLKEFYGSLNEAEQTMLVAILDGAQRGGDFGDYIWTDRYGGSMAQGWSDTVEYFLEDDESAGFSLKIEG